MKYKNPAELESSYAKNDLGKTLYSLVLEHKPKKIVEFGVLNGYSTIAMAMALHELGGGHINSYDLFDDYPFKHSTMHDVRGVIDRYGLAEYVTLKKKDFDEWLSAPEQFDFMHVDISNKGDTIERLYEATRDQIQKGSVVVFEGGSKERDNVEWMKKFNQKKMSEIAVPFSVIDERFPSLSMIKNT